MMTGISKMTDHTRHAAHRTLPFLMDEQVSHVALKAPGQRRHFLHPDELSYAAAIVHLRRREEFLRGRSAAHLALAHFGVEPTTAIKRGPAGEALWPDGFVGSITHCHPWTIAAVGRQDKISAIGIDLESTERMRIEDVRRVICRPPELAWVASGDPVERLTMLFAAKEAIFKAIYPSCLRRFDFLDVELTPAASENQFVATLQANLSERRAKGHSFEIRYSLREEFVFASLVERRSL
jgi:enterobactin synthetase component D